MNTRIFNLAKKLSYKSDYNPHKIGSVITDKKGKILGLGFNRSKTHVRSNTPWKTLHAELSAIINTGQENLIGANIFVYRETKDGKLANSKPCIFCQELLKQVGISTMFYSTNNGFVKEDLL